MSCFEQVRGGLVKLFSFCRVVKLAESCKMTNVAMFFSVVIRKKYFPIKDLFLLEKAIKFNINFITTVRSRLYLVACSESYDQMVISPFCHGGDTIFYACCRPEKGVTDNVTWKTIKHRKVLL